jgi:SAM-dependent methyltransferase
MRLMENLIKYGKKQSFQPTFLSIFLNPFYLIRKELFISITSYSNYMGGIMLDFGCGRKPYKNLFEVDEYIGVDIEVSGHQNIKNDVEFYYNGKTLPFEDEFFDSIFSSEVFEHVFNLNEIVSELHRVLKKDGYALITFPFCWIEHEIPYDFARYTSFAAKSIIENAGFKLIGINKSGNYFLAVWQLIINYFFELLSTRSAIVNTILVILLISPFNVIGIALNFIFPTKDTLYFNNIILIQK